MAMLTRPRSLLGFLLCMTVASATTAHATTSIGAWIQHSPDDINATDVPGFQTLSGNDSIATPTLPFSVTIDGVTYNTVAISTNGWLEFGGNSAGDTDPSNDCLPTPAHTRPFLAAYWDDLQTTGSNIRYGTVGTSPNRTFFVDAQMDTVAGSSDLLSYQVQIHEGSGLITVRYRSTEHQANGQLATIGWQGAGGAAAQAQPLTCNGKILDDNRPDEGFSVDPSVAGRHVVHAMMAYSPDDITGFTSLTGDNNVATPTMPFSVNIRGTNYNTVAISTNGWLEFGGNTAADSTPNDFPLPTSTHTNPFLAAYWDNMQTQGTAIRYGSVGASPNRVYIVDFQLDTVASGSSDALGFQVQIHETSNVINVKYRDPLGVNASGPLAQIGFQTAGGASALAFPLTSNGRVLDDNRNTAMGWSVHAGPSVPVLHATIAHSPDDISGFTTMGSDNQVANVSLPFSVIIDGVSYGTVAVSTNGWLEFGGNTAADSTPANTALPTASHTNPFLAAFWDDLVPEGSQVRYGTVGASPNRTFIVDYEAWIQPSPDSSNDAIAFQVQVHEGSNVVNVQYRTVQRYTAGQTATIGWQGAGGASATARPLTFNGRILDDNLPNAGWSVSPIPVCGNGLNETSAGEQCDLGANNGAGTSCCTATCGFRASGSTCRASAGVCDVAETCSGSSATCPANGFVGAGTECRGAAGLCDVAETCTGSGAACPADAVATAGTGCRGAAGVCDVAETCDGTNVACPADLKSTAPCRAAAGVCDVAESCDGVGNDCPADVLVAAATECRGAAGACDVAEACTGSSPTCPTDGFVAGGTECRGAAGVCDVAESCTGSGPACPADVLVTAGTECRGAAGDCDLAEACDGSNAACPADVKSTATCRASAGDCDVAESCDGVANDCPTDGFAPSSTTCRATAGDCDVAESCTGTGAACPADVLVASGTECRASAGVCDVAETCDGASAACPTDGFVASGTECRGAAGLCDVAESCDGASAACPTDAVATSGTECRGAAGVCDVAESCDGVATACPADAKSTAECRASAGACDVAESCDGVGDACPADGLVASGTECRGAAGVCDVAEACDGASAACPADVLVSAGTECRGAAGVCDVAESCDGANAACPTDAVATSGTECRGAAGVCDVAESCDGVGTACPADAKSTAACRAAAGDCDVAEVCDGVADACPADGLVASGTECRAASGACDVAESCDGATPACPADGFVASGTECRAAAGDCDVAEACTGSGPACPTDDLAPSGTECRAAAGQCDVAESCTGDAVDCPTDSVAGAFVVCRAAAGDCDVPESCDGVSGACPADAKAPATTECRASGGVCDVAETCDGASDACPADGKVASGTECRGAAGVCDVAESCDGATDACPADAKSTAVCRPSAGDCDVAESCSGSSDTCPVDAFASSSTVCRAASGVCDVAEICTGSSAACPADAGSPDGDGDGVCDLIDVCVDVADPAQPDGDGDGRGDACDPCTNTFNGGSFATKAKLVATKILPGPGDDKLKIKGFVLIPTTPTIEPDVNGLRLILEKQDGTPIFDATLPAATYSTATRAGWRANGPRSKFLYKNAGTSQPLVAGIGKLSFGLSPKTPGLVKLSLSGKGGTYGPIAPSDLPLKWTIVVDVPNAATGQCAESNYTPAECQLAGNGSTAKCTRK